MRDLVPRQLQHLFPYKFCNDQALGLIGHHIVGIVLRSLGQIFFDLRKKTFEIFLRACRDRHNPRKVVHFRVVCKDGQHLLARDAVHLVDREQDGHAYIRELL